MRQALRDLKVAVRERRWGALTREDRIVLVILVWLGITVFGLWQAEVAIRGLHHLSNGRVVERKATDRRACEFVRDHVVIPDRATVESGPRQSVPILRNLGFSDKQIKAYLKAQYKKGGPVKTELARRPIPNCNANHPFTTRKP
jgi:hypothetical protein